MLMKLFIIRLERAMPGEDPPRRSRIPKASDILANALTVRILSEGLKPGSNLPSESALIDEYQFSRGTVREALRLLESYGLVRVRRGPKGGVEVSAPDVSRVTQSMALLYALDETPLRDLVEFRLIVEPPAAAMAARSATDGQRAALVAAAGPKDAELADAVDFHRLVSHATNNGFMRTILTAVHQVLEWETRGETLDVAHDEGTRRAHRKIASAISAGEATKAESAMRSHLTEFRRVLDAQGRLDKPIVPRPTAASSLSGLSWA